MFGLVCLRIWVQAAFNFLVSSSLLDGQKMLWAVVSQMRCLTLCHCAGIQVFLFQTCNSVLSSGISFHGIFRSKCSLTVSFPRSEVLVVSMIVSHPLVIRELRSDAVFLTSFGSKISSATEFLMKREWTRSFGILITAMKHYPPPLRGGKYLTDSTQLSINKPPLRYQMASKVFAKHKLIKQWDKNVRQTSALVVILFCLLCPTYAAMEVTVDETVIKVKLYANHWLKLIHCDKKVAILYCIDFFSNIFDALAPAPDSLSASVGHSFLLYAACWSHLRPFSTWGPY